MPSARDDEDNDSLLNCPIHELIRHEQDSSAFPAAAIKQFLRIAAVARKFSGTLKRVFDLSRYETCVSRRLVSVDAVAARFQVPGRVIGPLNLKSLQRSYL